MRLLHVVHQYPPDYLGGTELYTQSLARRQAEAGHDVAVFAPVPHPQGPDLPRAEVEAGVRVYRAPAGPRSATALFLATFAAPILGRAFRQLLALEKPDLVHIQHVMGLPAALARSIRAAGIPYLVTLHDYYYLCANAQLLTNYDQTVCPGPRWWLNCGRCALARAGHDRLAPLAPAVAPLMALRHRQLARLLAHAAHIIAPTHFVASTYGGMGIAPGQMTVVPHGLALSPGKPIDRPARPAGAPLSVIFFGSLAWQKGVHTLVAAVNRLPAGTVRLSIFGNENVFPDYVAALKAMARHPAITFGGPLDRAALWQALAAADVAVVPSLWYEVSPLVINEAFAAGLPIVASDLGGLAELIADGRDGLLVPPGDDLALANALQSLHRHPDLLAHLRAGIRPVPTLADHHDAVIAIYRQLIPTHK
jgi:glycosyltransferase involved in cell wall biosynthesis